MDVNPQVLQLPPRELLVLPPEQIDLWSEPDKENYDIWKGEHQSIKNTKEDYRIFIMQLNKDYNIEEIYDHIETGLSALERLVAISKKFPAFDVENDIENIYAKDNMMEKDFVKFGFKLVLNFYENSGHLSQLTPTQKYSADSIKDNNMSKVDSNTKVEEAVEETVEEAVEENMEKDVGKDVEKDEEKDVEKDVEKEVEKDQRKKKKRKKKNIEYRQKRLLKFHEKLVETSGLPPSRLMKKQKQNLLRRNLAGEFQQIGGGFEASPTSSKLLAEAASSGPWTDGCCGVKSVTPEWPEARPVLETDKFTHHSSHLYCGSTSGFSNQPSLSPSSQYSVVWPVSVPVMTLQPPMVSPGGSPAYCFHCMQFGSVFTVSPV